MAETDMDDLIEIIEKETDISEIPTSLPMMPVRDVVIFTDMLLPLFVGMDKSVNAVEEAVAKGIPAVMLTAHAINPDTLMSSIRKGAISYLPKETLADLDELLEELLAAQAAGEPPWKLLFDKLGAYFDKHFGPDWKSENQSFWSDFSQTWEIGRGIQERLKHDQRLLDKGV